MAFDNDQLALEVLKNNIDSEIACADLSTFDQSIVDRIAEANVLVAGPPCQGFSTAGKNNPDDLRNNHLLKVTELAALAKPEVVVIENVKGLLNQNNKALFGQAKENLERSGYNVTWDLHCAADYKIAQNRHRVIIVATLTDTPFELKLKCEERISLSDALSNIETDQVERGIELKKSSSEYKIANRIKPGQKLSNVRRGLKSVHTWEIPEVFGAVTTQETSLLETIVKLRRQNRKRENGDADPVDLFTLQQFFGSDTLPVLKALQKKGYVRTVGDAFDIKNTFNGKYRRLDWQELSPTVDTRFGQPRYFLHPDSNRGFSTREAARIQSFPDEFEFHGSQSRIYRMIGNAVPPRMAQLIAEDLKNVWSSA